MGQLEDIQVFIRVVEAGSITKAAEQLNLAKSAVSKRLAELENNLATKLINRTTRHSSLTEAGSLYYQRAVQLVDDIHALNSSVSSNKDDLSGSLKLAVPLSFGLSHLMPALGLFMQENPKLKVQVDFSDRKIDIIEDGFDLAFRIGVLTDSSLHARTITPIKHVLCASPDYLKQHGRPTLPEQLKQHKLLKYAQTPLAGLKFVDQADQEHTVHMQPYFIANNGDALKQMALSGHGLTMLPTFLVWDSLAIGDLELVMPDYSLPLMHAYALYPPTRYLSQKVRHLIDFLITRFGDHPYWDQNQAL